MAMRTVTTLLLFNLLFVLAGNSQTEINIKGVVKDSVQQPLEGAVISLLRYADSTLVKAGISEANGSFEVAANENGPFFLMIRGERREGRPWPPISG